MLHKKAFTLPELLLATALIVFTLCTLLTAFIAAIFLIDSNRNLTLAIGHAQFALEEIKDTNFNSVSNFTWTTANITAKGLTPLINEALTATKTGVDPLFINITVNWQDRTGRNKNISLETLITDL